MDEISFHLLTIRLAKLKVINQHRYHTFSTKKAPGASMMSLRDP
jgi:hypothetical protein